MIWGNVGGWPDNTDRDTSHPVVGIWAFWVEWTRPPAKTNQRSRSCIQRRTNCPMLLWETKSQDTVSAYDFSLLIYTYKQFARLQPGICIVNFTFTSQTCIYNLPRKRWLFYMRQHLDLFTCCPFDKDEEEIDQDVLIKMFSLPKVCV